MGGFRMTWMAVLLSALIVSFSGIGLAARSDQEQPPEMADSNLSEKRVNLLERQTISLDLPTWSRAQNDASDMVRRIRQMVRKETWQEAWRAQRQTGGTRLVAFLMLLGLAVYLLNKLRRYWTGFQPAVEKVQCFYRTTTVRLIERSIFLIGVTLFLYTYALVTPVMASMPFYWLVIWIMMILLFTRQAGDFINHWLVAKKWLLEQEAAILWTLLVEIRYLAIVYACVDWLIPGESPILIGLRMLLAVLMFVQVFKFWRTIQYRAEGEASAASQKRRRRLLPAGRGISYTLLVAGLVLDISGYGPLAQYWYTSWGITAAVLLWSALFFKLLLEWRQEQRAQALADLEETASSNGHPLRWLTLQLLWLVWFFLTIFSILLGWGGRQTVLVGFLRLLNYPIHLGKIEFSMMNFIYAFLILVVTHSWTRFWKFLLKEKILADSGLETGLKDSITTITVYTFWIFGILLSLHTFGLGTTSLALAFGALGIGLGFGLQNIFNNFISGIILLFERPIQVGDDVEINGVWATVKKINVRATVVQTYDNASLIIPNSEFISSQVTNWSFKDKRIRRNIDVGVAYGSNIQLVRELLLEIGAKTPKVFGTPKPDVVFRDFGDSALIFRLRVWTDIDNIFKVETAIRFEIDRRFNENGIVIAFPQQDVHLYYENKMPDGG